MCTDAVEFYKSGYNCSQCLLKAAKEKYDIKDMTDEQIVSCSAVNSGFGTGGICCVLVAAIMVFGMMFDEDTAKRMRIRLLTEFQMTCGNINCGRMRGYSVGSEGCSVVIDVIWNIMTKIIDSELKK